MGMVGFFRGFLAAVRRNSATSNHISDFQNQCLRRLLNHAILGSDFYKQLYEGIDIDQCRLSDLPIITKSDMMDNFDHLVTDSRLKLRDLQEWTADNNNFGKLYLNEFVPIPSSGSTGKYALVVYDRRSRDLIQATLLARHPLHAKRSVFEHAGMLAKQLLGTKARIAVMTATRGNVAFFIKTAPRFQRHFVKLLFLSVMDSVEKNVAALNEFQPVCLSANSSYLPILAQEQIEGRLNLTLNHPMSFLVGAAEPLTEHTRGLALNAWKTGLQNDYGAAECFFMATSCEKSGQLHAMNDLCILEAVDENGNAVPDGQYGEKILVTNLANFTQPIIRYEIDDVVGYSGQPCSCGLPFPSLLPLQGRKLEFMYFKKPQGGYERIHPYRLTVSLYYLYNLKQYQIVQTARNELTFFYVSQGDQAGFKQQLRQTLQDALAQSGLESRITLILKRVETINRDQRSGKYKPAKTLGAPSDLDTVPTTKVF